MTNACYFYMICAFKKYMASVIRDRHFAETLIYKWKYSREKAPSLGPDPHSWGMSLLLFSFSTLFMFLCVGCFSFVYDCALCIQGVQKRVSDPTESELQMAVSHHVDSGKPI